MVTFEQAAAMLDEAVDRLPKEIFQDLNGGVNLLPEEKRADDGSYVMGLYHHNSMGRYVELFYGSFAALYGSASRREFRAQLEHTLHHELTHHIESKAGDRTLERWDEEQALLRALESEVLETDSVLFVCESGALSAAAQAMFQKLGRDRCADVVCEFTALQPSPFPPPAVKAARAMGYELSGKPLPLLEEILAVHGAILCMTEAQAERFPSLDTRTMCLGPRDIAPPRFSGGWTRTLRRVEEEIGYLIEELCGEEEA